MGLLDKLKDLRERVRSTPPSTPVPAQPLPPMRPLEVSSITLLKDPEIKTTSKANPEVTRLELMGKTRTFLEKQPEGWSEEEYLLGQAFFKAIDDKSLTTKAGFASQSVRAILIDFVSEWNLTQAVDKTARTRLSFQSKSSGKLTDKNEKLWEKMEGAFSSLILSVQHALTEKYEDDLFRYLKSRVKQESPAQKDFSCLILSGQGLPVVGSGVVKIDEPLKILNHFHQTVLNDYGIFHAQPDQYLMPAIEALHKYYLELLKVNFTTQATNPWREPVVERALRFYFDQREMLHLVYAQTRTSHESMVRTNIRSGFMAEYREYLIGMFQRDRAFDYELSLGEMKWFSFGYSRSEKIAAAFEQYYALSSLPSDPLQQRSPQEQALINQAGENGRLGDLKQRVQEALNLNFETVLEQKRTYSLS